MVKLLKQDFSTVLALILLKQITRCQNDRQNEYYIMIFILLYAFCVYNRSVTHLVFLWKETAVFKKTNFHTDSWNGTHDTVVFIHETVPERHKICTGQNLCLFKYSRLFPWKNKICKTFTKIFQLKACTRKSYEQSTSKLHINFTRCITSTVQNLPSNNMVTTLTK